MKIGDNCYIGLGDLVAPTDKDKDMLVAVVTGQSVSEVEHLRLATEKAARRQAWEAELVARLPELIAWCRKDQDKCEFCDKLRSELSEAWGIESPLEAPEGRVIFSHDVPEDRYDGLACHRHDRYHVEKALRAIHHEEFLARQARREARASYGLKAQSTKAERRTKWSKGKQARREEQSALAKAMGCGRKKR